MQIDLLKNTDVHGIQIFNTEQYFYSTDDVAPSFVYDAYRYGRQTFNISYKRDGTSDFNYQVSFVHESVSEKLIQLRQFCQHCFALLLKKVYFKGKNLLPRGANSFF